MEKPELLANQTAHYFSVTSIDFEKSYKVMGLRIERGFSDRDLSFLLGYYPLYVRDIENPLHKKRYKAKDTNYLLHIFDCSLSEIMHGGLSDLNYDISILTTSNSDGMKVHEIYKKHHCQNVLFISFTEHTSEYLLPPKSIATARNVRKYLINMIAGDFLRRPKTGLEIYHDCTTYFNGHIKPSYIADAIKEINKASGTKINIGKNEMRRWIYSIR